MRLIDADELDMFDVLNGYYGDAWRDAQNAINHAPTIDAVEVVRCKECIHYESDGGALMVCRIDDMVVDDTDYCSYGEREGE